MYKKALALLAMSLALVLNIAMAGALNANANVEYQIFGDKVLVDMSLGDKNNFLIKIPSDYTALELNTEGYQLIDFGKYKSIRVENAEGLKIKYITKSLIDKSRDKYFFVLRNNLSELIDIELFLPEGAVLLEEDFLAVPEPSEISSDGRRIVLSWRNFNDKQIIAAYEFVNDSNLIYWLFGLAAVLAIAVFYFIKSIKTKRKLLSLKKKIKSKTGNAFKDKTKGVTRNLFGEEKSIVEYLLKKEKNECWTKEIAKELSISKVRLSRRLRNLEQKGLIERIPYGNENRIKMINK